MNYNYEFSYQQQHQSCRGTIFNMKHEELIQKLKKLQLWMLSAAVLTLLLKYLSTISNIGSTKTLHFVTQPTT